MLDAEGRVVMISGPARGLGRAIAERLRSDGYTLSLGGRTPDAVSAVADGLSGVGDLSIHHFDALDADTARRWVADTLDAHGRIDVLINNAGVLDRFDLDDYDEAAFDHMWRVNVKAPTLLTHLCLPSLRTAGHGRVVNIASLSGKRVKGGFAPGYAMTKHAVMALTHATRQQGWSDGVRAVAVCPSFIDTDMIAGVETGDEPVIGGEDIAELISTALRLPDHASVAELVVNCRKDDLF